MNNQPSALADWTPEQIALGKRWVEIRQLAAVDLERIRRKEIRELDTYKTIRLTRRTTRVLPTPQSRRRVWSNNSTGSRRLRAVNEVIQAAGELEFEQ